MIDSYCLIEYCCWCSTVVVGKGTCYEEIPAQLLPLPAREKKDCVVWSGRRIAVQAHRQVNSWQLMMLVDRLWIDKGAGNEEIYQQSRCCHSIRQRRGAEVKEGGGANKHEGQ